jgi:hypothetical protein
MVMRFVCLLCAGALAWAAHDSYELALNAKHFMNQVATLDQAVEMPDLHGRGGDHLWWIIEDMGHSPAWRSGRLTAEQQTMVNTLVEVVDTQIKTRQAAGRLRSLRPGVQKADQISEQK